MALDAELLLFTPILKSEDVLHMPENVVGVDLNKTAPVGALADDVQMKGTKRCRRERSDSTGKLERVSKLPRSGTPGKRSSIYRGVTRHRWTGRYEAHLWDKSTWNVTQKKKGKQVYLGAYDEEESAARAYDLAALKYWGPTTLINFPVSDYTKDLEEMHNVSREEYLASLRRKSSGFSRGVSKYRGVARHHHNGRWEARIGRVFGNKYLYLGTYSTQEEAAAAYDMAAIEYRGVNAVTNFDLSRYIRWLRPGHVNGGTHQENGKTFTTPTKQETQQHIFEKHESPRWSSQQSETLYQLPSLGYSPGTCASQKSSSSAPTALSLLLQSSMFKQMLERVSGVHDVIDSDHDAGIELACSDLVSGQHFVEQLHSDIAKSSYEENGCRGSMYHALEDDSSGFAFGSTEESMQFGFGTDEQIPLDHGLSLWNGFLPKAGESLLGHL